MPEYNKRESKGIKPAKKPSSYIKKQKKPKKPIEERVDKNIDMKPSKIMREAKINKTNGQKTQNTSDLTRRKKDSRFSNLQIINGRKRSKKTKSLIGISFSFIAVIIVVLLHLISPTGLLEFIQNRYVSLGGNRLYQNSLEGGEFYNMSAKSGNICIVSDTYYEAYNPSGKKLVVSQHGFSSPELCESSERSLVYDRGGKGFKIYNMSGLLFDKQNENVINSAKISRNGSIALVIKPTGYASGVEIYDKNLNIIFTWNSTDHFIADVVINRNSKQIAVVTLYSKNGLFGSTVYVFDIGSQTPKYSLDFNDSAITSLKNINENEFLAISDNSAVTLGWKSQIKSDIISGNSIRKYDVSDNGDAVFVYGSDNNSSFSSIKLVPNIKNAKAIEFSVNGIVKDVAYVDDVVYCLIDNKINSYSLDGSLISTEICGYNSKLICSLNGDGIAYISDSKLNRYSAQ